MNKLKLNIIILGVLSLGLYSCKESYLDVKPETSIFDENYYQTIEDFENALIGCYDGYQRTSSNVDMSFYVTSEVMSDECFGGVGVTNARNYQILDRLDQAESPSDNNLFNTLWSEYYIGIFRCNKLLQEAENISWEGDEETKARILGETHFLRAKLYFDLVRLFNNVPLLTEPSDENIAQASPSEVYKVIAEDLKFAAENINYPAYSSEWAATNDGRATQWAAKALLGRVFLFYTGYYGQSDIEGIVDHSYVLAGLENVIDEGGFGLVEEYKNLWEAACTVPVAEDNTLDRSAWAGRGNKELVFTQKFNYTQDYNGNLDGNRWLVMMGLRNTNYSPYGQGWGSCTVNPKTYQAFHLEDPRRSASIIDIEGEGIAETFDFDDQREYTGYTVKKYTPMAYPDGTTALEGLGDGNFQHSQYQDFVVIRYSDVLLMAAEMGSNRAQEFFDMVRGRVGLSSKTATIENILEERRYEFAFEGLRYWDLLRQGIQVAANTIALDNYPVLSGNDADYVTISAANIIEKGGFMQIPNTQITLSNGVLKQNPGWE